MTTDHTSHDHDPSLQDPSDHQPSDHDASDHRSRRIATERREASLQPDGRAVVVTGVAGFIGHHTARRLLDLGHRVIGVDSFTPYYAREVKEMNLRGLRTDPRFRLLEHDVADVAVTSELAKCRALIHLAAQPGVRDSWADFDRYVDLNVRATKRLLDAALAADLERVVVASSSSVYGNAPEYPTSESDPTQPVSPYGITKLATERLSVTYADQFGLPTVSMRYFTVYGPGQRPDMAIQRLVAAAHSGATFPMYGDGTQIRDFTYVADAAEANCRAALLPDVDPGAVLNVCSGSPVTLLDVVAAVEAATGAPVRIEQGPASPGDVRRTGGSSTRSETMLAWRPTCSLSDGIAAQVDEHRRRISIGLAA
jgi:nucleoside-diphosphate-sugar epimerase